MPDFHYKIGLFDGSKYGEVIFPPKTRPTSTHSKVSSAEIYDDQSIGFAAKKLAAAYYR